MTNEQTTADAVARAGIELRAQLHRHVDAIATDYNLDHGDTLHKLRRALAAELAGPTSLELDGRAARWLCRFRIYDQATNKLEADSEYPKGPEAPGTWEIAGLPMVGMALQDLCRQFHGAIPLSGMSQEAVDRSLRGLRPTLARHKGSAVWRMHYDTPDTYADGRTTKKRGFLARVDIVRSSPAKETKT